MLRQILAEAEILHSTENSARALFLSADKNVHVLSFLWKTFTPAGPEQLARLLGKSPLNIHWGLFPCEKR